MLWEDSTTVGISLNKLLDIGAGVIDPDYRGSIGVVMINNGADKYAVRKGDRVAQFICEKIIAPAVVEAEQLDATTRGVDGFDSTEKHEG